METYNYNDYKEAGIDQVFVQDNQSASKRRSAGLHFQINYPQDKLVRAIRGEVFDVAVDLRPAPKPMVSGTVCCFPKRTKAVLYPQEFRTAL
ncbi:MAG: dTDP-4-dehydrorhamnose 3,5-epimerase family protein [Gallintestinimicrobium sp.]